MTRGQEVGFRCWHLHTHTWMNDTLIDLLYHITFKRVYVCVRCVCIHKVYCCDRWMYITQVDRKTLTE